MRPHDGVISARTRDAREVLLVRVVVVRHRSQIQSFDIKTNHPVPEARVLVQVVVQGRRRITQEPRDIIRHAVAVAPEVRRVRGQTKIDLERLARL